MPDSNPQGSEVSQSWPRVGKPVTVVPGDSETEGYCPTGDLGCRGLVPNAEGILICGLAEYPDCTAQVAACNGRRQEAR